MAQHAAPPAAPTLTATDNPKEVRIEFDVPKDGETHAAVHLHEAGGATRMYDAASKKVLPDKLYSKTFAGQSRIILSCAKRCKDLVPRKL